MRKSCFVTGGAGNLACQLSWHLAGAFDQIVLVDKAEQPVTAVTPSAIYEQGDLLDDARMEELVRRHKPSAIIHLASLLSAHCERERRQGWLVNCDGYFRLLELALRQRVTTVLFPSSVASYGRVSTDLLQEDAPQWPDGLYGVTKLACERLGVYYQRKHGLEVRCLRLPVVISRFAPLGAASSYASRAFVESVRTGGFVFRVRPTTRASLLYVDDALDGLVQLLLAPSEHLKRNVYNLQGFSATAQDLADKIVERLPNARIVFDPDPQIADLLESWPQSIDDSSARRDWGWRPQFDLSHTAAHFINNLQAEGPSS